ncbi:MAG: sulfite exporter TauE/SafE family protein [Vulcanimicrobiaceae bacterium]
MTLQTELWLGLAAFVASALNAGAGGGSFISFPALLATGVSPIAANATNNTAMWLGGVSSAVSFRNEVVVERATFMKMLAASVAGSIVGALLLLRTSDAIFAGMIPFLLLAATIVFLAGPRLVAVSRRARLGLRLNSPLGLGIQTAVAVYGGFFGAAMGIVMLAIFGVLGMQNVRHANALKVMLSAVINGVAVIPFALAHVILLVPVVAMGLGAIAGGYLAAGAVKRIPPAGLRAFVGVVACAMTAYFFWKTYG